MTEDVHVLLSGGLVMWPLFLCGVISIAVTIERMLAIGITVVDNRRLITDVERLVSEGNYTEAVHLCSQRPGRAAALLATGLRVHKLSSASVERHMEEYALTQTPIMLERLSILDTIITVAPLLGLLGTVTGMIKAFHVVGSIGMRQPLGVTGGVAEALVATSAGLAIAIFTLPAYNFLTERVKEDLSEMEWRATQVLNMLARIIQ
jgi:biopolymer transport protein ExbB